MDIAKLIEQQDKLLDAALSQIAKRSVPRSILTRPVELQEARIDRLKQRIETLEQMKADHVERIDSEIKALHEEMHQLHQRIETDRQTFAAAMNHEAASAPNVKGSPKPRKK